jgi:hypothetical protein
VPAASPSAIATEVSAEALTKDRRLRDAPAWTFIVLGEATTQTSDETRTRVPDVSWHQPARLRNRIVNALLVAKDPVNSSRPPDTASVPVGRHVLGANPRTSVVDAELVVGAALLGLHDLGASTDVADRVRAVLTVRRPASGIGCISVRLHGYGFRRGSRTS